MKKFKYNWLVFGAIAVILITIGILIMPSVNVINSEKLVSIIIGVCIIGYLVFVVLANVGKYKGKSFEVKLFQFIEILAVLYLSVASFLLAFDISIIGTNGVVNQIGRVIGGTLFIRGLVIAVSEVNDRSVTRYGKLYIYAAIVLVVLGTYGFFNVNVTIETICWILFAIFAIIGIAFLVMAIYNYPKLTKEEKLALEEEKARKAAEKAELAANRHRVELEKLHEIEEKPSKNDETEVQIIENKENDEKQDL